MLDGVMGTVISLCKADSGRDSQLQGLAILCVGNVAQFSGCRSNLLALSAVEVIVEAFNKNDSEIAPVVDHYCMWALRMLFQDADGSSFRKIDLDLEKLARLCTAGDDHALGFFQSLLHTISDPGDARLVRMGSLSPASVIRHLVPMLAASSPVILQIAKNGGPAGIRALFQALLDATQQKPYLVEAVLQFYRENDWQQHPLPLDLLSSAHMSTLMALSPILFPFLAQEAATQLKLVARLIRHAPFRRQLDIKTFLQLEEPVRSHTSLIVWRCVMDGVDEAAFVPELRSFVQRCLESTDELVLLRAVEMAKELGMPLDVKMNQSQVWLKRVMDDE